MRRQHKYLRLVASGSSSSTHTVETLSYLCTLPSLASWFSCRSLFSLRVITSIESLFSFLLKINLDFHRTHNHERHNSFEFRAQNSAMKCPGSCPNWFICEAIEYALYPHRASLNPRLNSGLSKLLGRESRVGVGVGT